MKLTRKLMIITIAVIGFSNPLMAERLFGGKIVCSICTHSSWAEQALYSGRPVNNEPLGSRVADGKTIYTCARGHDWIEEPTSHRIKIDN
jgi:hypothetical protein